MTRVEVRFEEHEAHVEYDASRCTVASLLAAVANAADPRMPAVLRAAVKK